ncbi:hypothetical protein SBA4_1090010 [Candidatus Sulfopaludibacter sp. SbA4]|nr:hypothetical protein SBA4_1090010 [Candidatus Sulfopaludibacter sp. SbA4]
MTVDGSPLQVGASNGLDVLVPIFKDAVSHGTWGLVGLSLLLVGFLAYLFRKQATRAERILIIVLVFSGIGALSFQLGSVHTGGRCAEFSSSGKCLKYRIPVEMMDAGSGTFRQYFFRDMPERQKIVGTFTGRVATTTSVPGSGQGGPWISTVRISVHSQGANCADGKCQGEHGFGLSSWKVLNVSDQNLTDEHGNTTWEVRIDACVLGANIGSLCSTLADATLEVRVVE